eukprot:scaffold209732_cov39-Tisochrysis_lutea.AAC.3
MHARLLLVYTMHEYFLALQGRDPTTIQGSTCTLLTCSGKALAVRHQPSVCKNQSLSARLVCSLPSPAPPAAEGNGAVPLKKSSSHLSHPPEYEMALMAREWKYRDTATSRGSRAITTTRTPEGGRHGAKDSSRCSEAPL